MNDFSIPLQAVKGRGAATRIAHRFERDVRDAFDDGWGTQEEDMIDSTAPKTEVRFEDVKSVLTRNDSPDIPFDCSLNPYRGCEHGCIYCFARPTHSYLNMSPGLDFETKLIAKRNIVEVLRAELGRKGYRPSQIALGTATDCYQPIERELRLTRSVIELLSETRHPFGIVTKSSAVERDLDLIAPMAADRLAAVYITVTTLDGDLCRKLEPRAAAPHRRLRTIRALADAGVPVGVCVAPQIPFITDDMEQVLEAAWEAGARSAFYTVIRLPWEVAPLFKAWLDAHFPDRASKVMAIIASIRDGRENDPGFFTRMRGSGPWAELLRTRFQIACRKHGMNVERIALRSDLFRPLAGPQGDLFG